MDNPFAVKKKKVVISKNVNTTYKYQHPKSRPQKPKTFNKPTHLTKNTQDRAFMISSRLSRGQIKSMLCLCQMILQLGEGLTCTEQMRGGFCQRTKRQRNRNQVLYRQFQGREREAYVQIQLARGHRFVYLGWACLLFLYFFFYFFVNKHLPSLGSNFFYQYNCPILPKSISQLQLLFCLIPSTHCFQSKNSQILQ